MQIMRCLWANRELISTLVKRDVVGRYRGSLLGIFWSFFNPLLMLLVYTFVFSSVFKARWGGTQEGPFDFAIALFAGLMVFNLFTECLSRAPTLITDNANYVKRIIFPLEILPFIPLGSALFHFCVSFIVWLSCYSLIKGPPHPQTLLIPIVMLPLIALTLGLSWLLSSIGVFIRDISQVVSLAISMLMFLSPIFYPISALPPLAQRIMLFNPLAQSVDQFRSLLLLGAFPDMIAYGAHLVVASIIAWIGFLWFQGTRRAFADVL